MEDKSLMFPPDQKWVEDGEKQEGGTLLAHKVEEGEKLKQKVEVC